MSDVHGAAYSRDEVGEVIAAASDVAAERQRFGNRDDAALSYRELRAIARELDIDERDLLTALARREQRRLAAERAERSLRGRVAATRRRIGDALWRVNVAAFAGMAPALAAIDWLPDGALDWAWYPIGGWGGLVLTHAALRWQTRRAVDRQDS